MDKDQRMNRQMWKGDNISYVVCSHHQTFLQDMQGRHVGLCYPSPLTLLWEEFGRLKMLFCGYCRYCFSSPTEGFFQEEPAQDMTTLPSVYHLGSLIPWLCLTVPSMTQVLAALYATTLPDCHHPGKGQLVFQNWGDVHHGPQTSSGSDEICSRDGLSMLKMD